MRPDKIQSKKFTDSGSETATGGYTCISTPPIRLIQTSQTGKIAPMNAKEVVNLIDKLIEERLRLASVVESKTLGPNKPAFLSDCKKRVTETREKLIQVLGE